MKLATMTAAVVLGLGTVGVATAQTPAPGTSTTPSTPSVPGGAMFATIGTSDRVSSALVGTEVTNSDNKDIGTIKDIALDGTTVKAYIVGVGGFLGMGDHYVAVAPSSLQLRWDNDAKKWRATMNATADQLKAAPEYKYPLKS